MKEDNNILDIKHLCPNCNIELELSSTDEIQSKVQNFISNNKLMSKI